MGNLDELSDWIITQVGNIDVRYSVREPSPDKWNAIGLISGVQPSRAPGMSTSSPMIVGVGSTPEAAVNHMIERIMTGDHPALTPTQPAARSTDHMDLVHSGAEQVHDISASG